MDAVQINASVLVNRGLQATAFLDHADLGVTSTAVSDVEPPGIGVEVLASFRNIALDPKVQLVAPELAGIFDAFVSTTDLATWAINTKYAETGGADGVLGRTLGAVTVTPNNAGFSRSFQSGAIYWHPNTGAHALHGSILARWQELGAESGYLGFPASEVMPGTDVRAEGFFAHFQGGSIYWSPPSQFGELATGVLSVAEAVLGTLTVADPTLPAATGGLAGPRMLGIGLKTVSAVPGLARTAVAMAALDAGGAAIGGRISLDLQAGIDLNRPIFQSSAGSFEVHGAIRERYLALGAEASILGYPLTDESGTPDGRGRFNHFQGGSVYWTSDTGAHEVHGLLRDRWSALGWERNPQLGYPTSDELIPDPRVGHRRPEVIKKPIASLPAGVIKFPAAAGAAGFPASVVNSPLPQAEAIATLATSPIAMMVTADPTAPAGPTRQQRAGVLGALSAQLDTPASLASALSTPIATATPMASTAMLDDALTANTFSVTGTHATDFLSQEAALNVVLDPAILGILNGPASTPGQRSVNRFADFESGVLFWFRGATSASVLTPLSATSDGDSLAFTGADIAALAIARLGRPSLEFGNAQLLSMSFVGTTPYSHDGAQVHNRRHRLQLALQGVENQSITGPFGIQIPQIVPVTVNFELQVEVWFDAAQRRIALALVDWWMLQASTQSYAMAVEFALHDRLDPLLWQSFELMTLPDTDSGAAMAVLSVKTLANGAVVVFVEPNHIRLLNGIGDLANLVTTPIFQFAQPN